MFTINLNEGVKNQKNGNVQTIDFMDMVTHIGADQHQLVEDKNGRLYLQLLNAETKDYFSIKLGDNVGTLPESNIAGHLLDNYTIFCGKSDTAQGYSGNVWFTFGVEGTGNEPKEKGTIAELVGKGLKIGNLKTA